MLQVQRILAARDFSECSDVALRYAADLARRTGAELHTLHAEVPHAEPKRNGNGVRRTPPWNGEVAAVQVRVCDVAAAPAILQYAEEHDVDLIVMGTHGRRGVRRLLLGSVAEEVVRLAACPVLTVRAGGPDAVPDGIDSVVVPIDFSRHARAALMHAREVALRYGARLDLLHVVEERLHPAFYNTGIFSLFDLQPDIDDRARRQLLAFYEEAPGAEVPEVRPHVRYGHAAQQIARFAEEERAGMIVMSTHGLTGLSHFFIGSVAEKVVRAAPCPVFTVKAFGKLLVAPEAPRRAESTH